jgi:MFS superfamily sulfate permease-like transporter
MAYAELAGLSPVNGLYALLLPTVAYALLGSSRRLVVGPEGSIAALVAVSVLSFAAAGSADAAELAAMLALLVAACYLLALVLRLAWVADYFSRSVLVGYIHGVVVVLIIGQLGKLTGISITASDLRQRPVCGATHARGRPRRAVSGMIDFSKLRRLWRAHLGEFWLATGALAGVVVIDVLPGVLIGVALSFMLLIRRLDHPTIEVLGRAPDGSTYADAATNPEVRAVPGVLVYAFRAPLVFANAEIFTDDLTTRADGPSPRPDAVILDCEGMAEVDTTGADALRQLHETLGMRGQRLLLARVNNAVVDFLHRDRTLETLGEDAIYATVRSAVAAAQSGRATRGGDVPERPATHRAPRLNDGPR